MTSCLTPRPKFSQTEPYISLYQYKYKYLEQQLAMGLARAILPSTQHALYVADQ